jgi:hypothetical protein
MTMEWIQVDCHIDRKAETLEIAEASGVEVSLVVGLMVRLWGWASLETADGTIRMTVSRLRSMFGGDAAFWKAVETAGWLEVAEEAGTITIPGWEKRFSQSAKSRSLHARRAAISRAKAADNDASALERTDPVRSSARKDIREEESRSTTTTAAGCEEVGGPAWLGFLDLWNKGPGTPWTTPLPPNEWTERTADPGWLAEAVQAVERLKSAKFFEHSPVSLLQFLSPDFVRRANGGHWDAQKKKARGPRGDDGGPSAAAAAERWKKGAAESVKRNQTYKAQRIAARDCKQGPT